MRKGFTLVELLGVIVILALIVAIVSPIILTVMNNVKISSFKSSMYSLEKSLEIYYYENPFTEGEMFTCEDGICKNTSGKELKTDGDLPDSGTITISKSGDIIYDSIMFENYSCEKISDDFSCRQVKEKIIETDKKNIEIVDNTTTNLNNYKIYGNSVQKNYKGKNLFNIPEEINYNKYAYYPTEEQNQNLYDLEVGVSYVYSGEFTHSKEAYTATMNGYLFVQLENGSKKWLELNRAFTLDSKITSVIGIYGDDLGTWSLKNAMIERGTQKTEYEPYVGKKISPNYLYPQEINNLGNKSKNLLEGIEKGNYGTNGVNTDNFKRLRNKGYIAVKPNTKYTISWKSKDTTNPVKVSISDFVDQDQERTSVRSWYSSPTTFTTSATTNYIRLMFIATTEEQMAVEDIYDVQFEEGAIVTDYVPIRKYNIPIIISSKNLLPISYDFKSGTIGGIDCTINEDGSVTLNGTTISDITLTFISHTEPINFKAGTYTLSGNPMNNKVRIWLREVGSSTNMISTYDNNSSTITLEKDTDMYCYVSIPSGTTIDNQTIYPQIEKGEVVTSFVANKEKLYNIYLDEPLRKLGSYVDYIDYYHQSLVRNIGSIELTGDEEWLSNNDEGFYLNKKLKVNKNSNISISSHFKYGYSGFWFDNEYLNIEVDGINDVDKFKEWLRSEYENGTPVTIQYPLKKSVVEDIELPKINLNSNYSSLKIKTYTNPNKILLEYK